MSRYHLFIVKTRVRKFYERGGRRPLRPGAPIVWRWWPERLLKFGRYEREGEK